MEAKELIARRIAKMLKDGDFVNLGIGLPTEVANYLPEGIEIILQSENGLTGLTGLKEGDPVNKNLTNAGGVPVGLISGGAIFDSSVSFSLIRGGHVDYTVLGALQVDKEGNLANWIVPGKMVPGMGGAMDLVAGSKKVIIAMNHTQKGEIKILEKCTLPLTAAKEVDYIVTELGFMEVTKDGIVLREIAPGVTVEEIQSQTECKLIIPADLKEMAV